MLKRHYLLFAPDAAPAASALATPAAPVAPAPAAAPKPEAPKPEPAPVADTPDPTFDASMDKQLDALRGKKEEAKKPDAAKPDPATAEPPKPDVAPDLSKAAPKALREQLEKTNVELKTARTKMADLEKKFADAEAKGKDTTALSEQMAAKDKQLEELQSELRGLKQEASPEFKAKYDKPFNDAADYAEREIKELIVTTEDGQTRAATWDDFAALWPLPKGKAIQQAKELFGDASSIVVQHLTELKRLDYQKGKAAQEERAQYQERVKADSAKAAQQKEAFQQATGKVRQELIDKHPDWYGEDPEDKDGNTELQEGFKALSVEPKTFAEGVMLHEQLRLNAAAFPRMASRFAKMKEENAALKAQIAEFQASDPGAGKTAGDDAPSGDRQPLNLAKELREAGVGG